MKTNKLITLMLALLLVLVALPWQGALAEGTRYYVKLGGDDSKDGLTWENAKASLKDVMDAASSGDEIWVAAGTYSPGNSVGDSFVLKPGVKVYGGFAGTEALLSDRDWETNKTILSGKIDENNRVYFVVRGEQNAQTNTTRLDGFTITGGKANVSHGSADRGGGMNNYRSSPTVANCAFIGNTASYIGGGMFNHFSSPSVENCVFSGNTANHYGGGMYNTASHPTVVNCTFSGNTAGIDGGGMYNDNSNPRVVNCTFSANTATEKGGGMYNNSSPTLANTILWGNTAANNDSGPDIYQNGSNFILKKCVVGEYKLNGATPDPNNSIITTNPNLQPLDKDGNAVENPAANPTKVYIYGLGTGSSAIDAGLSVGTHNGIEIPDTDQLGTQRPQGTGVDIGSCEVVKVTGVSLNKSIIALTVGGNETLQATITPSNATNQNVGWSSDNGAVATVDMNGKVTAVGVGQATITVKTDDGNKTATCTVTVSATGAQYTTVLGNNQTYTRGSGLPLELTIKRNTEDQKTFGLFRQLIMDGALVSESNYTKAGGSLIIRLKSVWLDTLSAGLHALRFVFEDGEAQASFTVHAEPGSFEDVAVPSASFTFTKLWKGGEESSIDWTLYDEMDNVASKLFNKKIVSPTEWRYEAYFGGPVVRYLVEKPVAGYQTRYQNVGVYAGITDRCCNGGTIINEKIPPTGDKADLALWAGLALLGLAGFGAVLIADRRRKKNK